MRLTPPRRARRRMAGLVMPWIVVAEHLAVTLGAALAETFAALAASRHFYLVI